MSKAANCFSAASLIGAAYSVLALASCSSAQQQLVGVTSGFAPGTAPYVSVDTSTGSFTTLSTSARSHNALAADSSGDLYASWFSGSGQQGRVSRLDPRTGVTLETFNAITPGAGDIRGLAFDGADTLFAVVNRNDSSGAPTVPDDLFTIDLVNETTTRIGSLGFTGVQGLDYSPSGELFAWDIFDGLLSVDPGTGSATDVGLPAGSGLIQSIVFSPDGTLFGVGRRLFTIDPSDGGIEIIGAEVGPDVRGAEWVAPEPAGIVVGVVLAGMVALDRRRFTVSSSSHSGLRR